LDEQDAHEALRAVKTVQGRLATRARWSWQRHAAFGLLMGGFVASYALPPVGRVIATLLCCLALVAIVVSDRRRDGFFVNGYRAGRTRWVTAVLLVVALGMLAAAMIGRSRGWEWAPIAAGSFLVVFATGASMAWERVYREELGGDE
jgi:hypothetical protein